VPYFLGIDVGTTKIAAVIVDSTNGRTVAAASASSLGRLLSPEGWSEWDADRAIQQAFEVAGEAIRGAGAGEIAGIGVTGQMHGTVLVGEDLAALTPFIGWQDRRGNAPLGEYPSAVAAMRALAGPWEGRRTGCRFATGYLGTTLFWLARSGLLPGRSATAAFLPDYLVARLRGAPPVTDPTNAASSGLLDVVERRWDEELLGLLDLPRAVLPEVRPTGTIVGTLGSKAATMLGLSPGVPTLNALGDNQASFFGSVGDLGGDVLINVGTGGQISAAAPAYVSPGALETRPFLGELNLLVGAGHVGGTAYALLRDFVREIGREVSGVVESENLYPLLDRLAAGVPSGADGLRCDPRFAGTRVDPGQRGSLIGLTLQNFTLGHLARALLEGVATTFRDLYREMIAAGVTPRGRLIGSGNGIRRNPLLAEILSETFGVPLVTPVHTEEAARGAALLAAVGTGGISSLAEAGRLIAYGVGR